MQSSKKGTVIAAVVIAALFATFQLSEPAFPMLHIPPHIRDFIWTVFIISGVALLLVYLLPLIKPMPETKRPQDKLKGKIIEYQTNRIGDIDKLLIDTKQQKVWVHFPPHTAKYVMKTAAKNDMAELSIRPSPNKTVDNLPMFELIYIYSSTSSFGVESIPHTSPATGKKVELTGKALQYKLDEKGVVAGIIMDKYLIDIPPHIVQNIFPVIKNSEEIIVKGYERNPDDGFVNVTGLTMIKPYAISIDKTDYLL